MDIRVVDTVTGYKYVTLNDIKKGDRFQFDFPDDPKDENSLGSDWFVASEDSYIDSDTNSIVVLVETPSNPRYSFSYLAELALDNISIERRGSSGYGYPGSSGEWEALI